MRRNANAGRYHAVAADGAVDVDHPLNRGRKLWWNPVPGLPAAGSRLPDLCGRQPLTVSPAADRTVYWLPGSKKFAPVSLWNANSSATSLVGAITPTFTTSSWTMACWGQAGTGTTTGGQRNRLVGYKNHYISLDANTFQVLGFLLEGSAWVTSSTPRTLGKWEYLLMTHDGGAANTTTLYWADSQGRMTSVCSSAGSPSASSALHLACYNETNAFQVGVTDVSVWNRILTDGERQECLSQGLSGYRTPDSPLRWVSSWTWFVPQAAGTISATLAVTLAAATVSATATVRVAGTDAATLDNATLAAVGAVKVSATLAAILDAASVSATATVRVAGTDASTLDNATLAGTAQAPVHATAAVTLADATLSATATVRVAGSDATTLDNATLAGTGAVRVSGTLASTLADATVSATAAANVQAADASQLDNATLAATARVTVVAALAAILEDCVVEAAGGAPDRPAGSAVGRAWGAPRTTRPVPAPRVGHAWGAPRTARRAMHAREITKIPRYVGEDAWVAFDYTNYPEVQAGETLSNPDVPAVDGVTITSPAVVTTDLFDAIAVGKAVAVKVRTPTAGTYPLSCQVQMSGGASPRIHKLDLVVS